MGENPLACCSGAPGGGRGSCARAPALPCWTRPAAGPELLEGVRMQPFRMAFGAAALAIAVGAGVFLWNRDHGNEARVRGLRDYNCDEPGKVYFGRLPLIRRPAFVASSDVYARIPEYARIRAEGISAETPLYTLLMKKASDVFLSAVAE